MKNCFQAFLGFQLVSVKDTLKNKMVSQKRELLYVKKLMRFTEAAVPRCSS